MTKCPSELPVPSVSRAIWDSISAEQQEQIKDRVAASWATYYFICAETHNRLVDEIEKDVP